MHADNNQNQTPDPAALSVPFTDLLYRVDNPTDDIAEVDEIVGGFDLGQALSTSMGLSPVATDLTPQSGHPAQPILPVQTVQTSSMTQMGVTVQLAPTT